MASGWQLELLDAFRYFTLVEGIALIVISAGSLVDAFIYAWPRERKLAISLPLLGRTMLVVFASWFVVHRLHHPLNWYTPVVMSALTCVLIGNWMSRKTERLWQDTHPPPVELTDPL
jgi:hypothetical protein